MVMVMLVLRRRVCGDSACVIWRGGEERIAWVTDSYKEASNKSLMF